MVEVTDEDRTTLDAATAEWCMGDNNVSLEIIAAYRQAIYERGKLEGARLAIEAAATVADHHRGARRSAHTDAHRRQAKQQATSLLARSLEAQQLMVAIRALSPAKIVGEG